ncbi:glycosyltransferase [Arthrobacter sp. NPDC057388]|jgi:glycosyltransferase involved in cell wall biosynthesis|uniref:glycosyltransferase n=1 Tax=Arthrobacter sp. NPDC057388 TaxID=3346116 RepID=UPI00362D497A
MKIALTKSSLLVPPTYFAVAHAMRMAGEETRFHFFTMAAEIRDNAVTVPVTDFAPRRDLPFKKREKYLPIVMPAMAKAISDYCPDIIHQHFATWSWPAVAASKRRDIPLLTTLHGADVVMAGRNHRSAMERWHKHNLRASMSRSQRILAVSEYLAALAVRNGFPAGKIDVHYQGVDTDIFIPDPLRRENPVPTALFIGALNHQKGISHLVEASNQLIGTVPHRLLVAGKGVLEPEIIRAAEQNAQMSFLGSLSREGVLKNLQHADVVIAPSRMHNGAREAAGLVLLEAQACGTPVIAYNSGGTSEMTGPESGRLVPEDDVTSLRRAMEDFFRMDPGSRSGLRGSAREFAVAERSLAKSCLELSRHYQELAR